MRKSLFSAPGFALSWSDVPPRSKLVYPSIIFTLFLAGVYAFLLVKHRLNVPLQPACLIQYRGFHFESAHTYYYEIKSSTILLLNPYLRKYPIHGCRLGGSCQCRSPSEQFFRAESNHHPSAISMSPHFEANMSSRQCSRSERLLRHPVHPVNLVHTCEKATRCYQIGEPLALLSILIYTSAPTA